ncbi:SDR family NAD(P)-dependent oxidoreductase [Actinosynnema sp. NPDC050436]|uniref:SDR family NAD(P)-dependent oxidoreductase n=1 Tax=Actinosynnema sp. NPDC050436 TaxID=3155659 RepID=UPI0033E9C6C7
MSTQRQPLAGTVALVTGASSGIGAATARRLGAEGAAVVLVARRRDRLEQVAADIAQAHVLPADLTDPAQATTTVDAAIQRLGRLDVLVNNAGTMTVGDALHAATDDWDRMLALNVRSLLHITHAALPHLVRAAADAPRRVADIVNVSSVAGRVTWPGSAVYSLTKSGTNAFAESLRQELLGHRVRVGVVEPGAVDTEIYDHLDPAARRDMDERMARIDPLLTEDVADAVAYLVTRDRRVAVNELLVRPADQTW